MKNKEGITKIIAKDFDSFSAKEIYSKLKNLSNKNKVNIAVSGGSTPLPILNILKNYDLDWSKFNFFLVDERVVNINSDESNFKNINNVFFKYINSKSYSILKKKSTIEDLTKNYKEQFEKEFDKTKDGFPIFDLMILGMGEDGHTASLFPNSKGLENYSDSIIINYVPQLKSNRITLTYPVLNASRDILVLIKGNKKHDVLKKISNGKGEIFPISKVRNSNIKWLIGK